MDKLKFETDCVHSTYEDITLMTEIAIDITYKTFLKHVSFIDLSDLFPFYGTHPKQGLLMIKNDWHVSYHKSMYKGKRCYYIEHSGIDYIFI
jgi:hypothetical protein